MLHRVSHKRTVNAALDSVGIVVGRCVHGDQDREEARRDAYLRVQEGLRKDCAGCRGAQVVYSPGVPTAVRYRVLREETSKTVISATFDTFDTLLLRILKTGPVKRVVAEGSGPQF